MPTVVVPFRGMQGKRRLRGLPKELRTALAEAMLADVVAASAAVGPVYVVTPKLDLEVPARLVPDPGHGQGAAVRVALDAAVAAGDGGPYLVVNADLPCATARDLLALAGSVPDEGLALVAADDGTTNALAFASADLFEPVYGPGSAERFAALAPSRRLDAPNLTADVDTVEDLERIGGSAGPHTRRALERLELGSPA
jgi:2-phospho-L-lactate guanylyltransferase